MRNLPFGIAAMILAGCAASDTMSGRFADPTARILVLEGGQRILVRASDAVQKTCDADANDCNFEIQVFAKGSTGPHGVRAECAIVIPDAPKVTKGQGKNNRITWTLKKMTADDTTEYYFPALFRSAVDLTFDDQPRRRNRELRDFDDPTGAKTTQYSYRILNLDKRDKPRCDPDVGDANDPYCGISFVAYVKRRAPFFDRTCDAEDPTIITSGP